MRFGVLMPTSGIMYCLLRRDAAWPVKEISDVSEEPGYGTSSFPDRMSVHEERIPYIGLRFRNKAVL